MSVRAPELSLPNAWSRRRMRKKLGLSGWLFVLPAFAVYAVFFLYPMISSLLLSFTSWDGGSATKPFVGLDNYEEMLHDPLVWQSLKHNIVWVVLGTILPIAIALLLAVLVSGAKRFKTIFRAAYFAPVVLAPTVTGIVWTWIYDPTFGSLNKTLGNLGLDGLAHAWLGEDSWALLAVLLAAIWAYFGFVFVIIMAGLQNIDQELIDAAKVDGAGAWRAFLHVTLPGLKHVLQLVTLLGLIGGFAVFDLVYVMTSGGPGNSTEMIATYAYRQGFTHNRVGYASALTMLMTLLALAVAGVYLLFQRGNNDR